MEVLNCYRTSKWLIASTYDGVVEVNRPEFEEWATDEQKREWIFVDADHNGDPVETGGTLSWNDYFKSVRFYEDLAEFIDLKKLKPYNSDKFKHDERT